MLMTEYKGIRIQLPQLIKRGDQFLSEFDKWYKTPFIQADGQWGKGVLIKPTEENMENKEIKSFIEFTQYVLEVCGPGDMIRPSVLVDKAVDLEILQRHDKGCDYSSWVSKYTDSGAEA